MIAVLQLVGSMRETLDDVRQIVDEEALPVSDRNMVDRALTIVAAEIEVVSRTLSDMLTDPTKADDC